MASKVKINTNILPGQSKRDSAINLDPRKKAMLPNNPEILLQRRKILFTCFCAYVFLDLETFSVRLSRVKRSIKLNEKILPGILQMEAIPDKIRLFSQMISSFSRIYGIFFNTAANNPSFSQNFPAVIKVKNKFLNLKIIHFITTKDRLSFTALTNMDSLNIDLIILLFCAVIAYLYFQDFAVHIVSIGLKKKLASYF